MSSAITVGRVFAREASVGAVGTLFNPLHALLAAPSFLYLATLAVMLFRPPNLEFYFLDRIAFALLAFVVFLRATVLRQALRPPSAAVWPMGGVLALVMADLLSRPFDATLWSVAGAKFVVPYVMFYLAGLVFDDPASLRRLETFALVTLAYLSFTAIACLADARWLVYPKFILDESLGLTPDRARGPFLQAVANGVTINLLGLIAVDAYRRRRLRGITGLALLVALPIAILATKTRAVWLSFAVTLVVLVLRTSNTHVRRLGAGVFVAAILGVGYMTIVSTRSEGAFQERLGDRNTVDFRMAAYQAGWEMFLERPWTGWGTHQIRAELSDRIEGFQGDVIVVHNTYLEVALEHGLAGLVLYAWIIFELFRLGRRPTGKSTSETFLSPTSWPLWPLLLGVYFVNATFVVMNYQFVNGLFFTFAGIVASQRTAPSSNAHSFIR